MCLKLYCHHRQDLINPHLRLSAGRGERPLEVQPVVSCLVNFQQLSAAAVMVYHKNPPTSVASDDKH